MTADEVYAILNKKVKSADEKATVIYAFRGTVASDSALPESANPGDVYNITQSEVYGDGANVSWDGEGWDSLGPVISFQQEGTVSDDD